MVMLVLNCILFFTDFYAIVYIHVILRLIVKIAVRDCIPMSEVLITIYCDFEFLVE